MKGLTELQSEILRRFFARRSDFFLTGGAALVGFYLHHRETHDLDLFTDGGPLDEGERTLREIASELHLEVEPVRRDPAFQRFLVRGRDESLIVDVMVLQERGLDPIAALPSAATKDAGVTASQLAWVLSSFPIPAEDAKLREYRDGLIRRLAAASFPS